MVDVEKLAEKVANIILLMSDSTVEEALSHIRSKTRAICMNVADEIHFEVEHNEFKARIKEPFETVYLSGMFREIDEIVAVILDRNVEVEILDGAIYWKGVPYVEGFILPLVHKYLDVEEEHREPLNEMVKIASKHLSKYMFREQIIVRPVREKIVTKTPLRLSDSEKIEKIISEKIRAVKYKTIKVALLSVITDNLESAIRVEASTPFKHPFKQYSALVVNMYYELLDIYYRLAEDAGLTVARMAIKYYEK